MFVAIVATALIACALFFVSHVDMSQRYDLQPPVSASE